MMNYLLKKKDALVKDNLKNEIIIPVRGAAIGNGWVDPFYQYDGSGFAYGLALIDWSQLVAFREMETQCQAELNLGHYNVPVCFSLIDKIIAESHGSQAPTKASGYDVRLAEQKHDDREFPPGHKVSVVPHHCVAAVILTSPCTTRWWKRTWADMICPVVTMASYRRTCGKKC